MSFLNFFTHADAQTVDKAKTHPPPPLPPRTRVNDNTVGGDIVVAPSTSQNDQLLPPLPPRKPKDLRNAADVSSTSRINYNNYNINGSDEISSEGNKKLPKLPNQNNNNNDGIFIPSPLRRFDTWFETRHPSIRQYKKALYVALVLFVIGVALVILLAAIGKFSKSGSDGSADVGRPGLTLNPGVGVGSCGGSNTDKDFVAALNSPQFGVYANPANSPVCGACIKINGPKGSVKVKIMDKCPVCKSGDVDLSPIAFNQTVV
ncbi:12091_t:CDS:2 [Ambispora gerdemannii]|uniref:12091_t:CDS:1 n=1 Tax=Ambispora gerdemannii TaxID=144530 RepID=A0A9N8WES2_9GLOM|nr:12091_t:CDS:2 [Ambispora gerdemannii]